jgi:D-alanine-D-alanine ligase
VNGSARPLAIPRSARESLRIMFIAKHANWRGGLHPEDGSHAIYHQEIRRILEELGLNLILADSYRSLFEDPGADFVFPLLNRGGFLNSEMLLPLLCNRLGIPFLGASPILRGVSDDKHLTKLAAAARGIPTAPWAIYRRGTAIDTAHCPRAQRYVVKPNASSASWGVSDAHDLDGVRRAVADLHEQGHDAIVEPFITGSDIEVSVITVDGEPLILPTMIVEQSDPELLRTYNEKRNLAGGQRYEILPFRDARWLPAIEEHARNIMREFLPFDYGRFEFRMDYKSGQVQFLEVNLNCNLWSEKTISKAARLAGWSHPELIETILCESLRRNDLLGKRAARPERYARVA